ncbi:MAG: hypothetical protein HY240_06220 [Actinobacteria bacterium]|nr:hypothetical protein [Actinomycetota bacterium]
MTPERRRPLRGAFWYCARVFLGVRLGLFLLSWLGPGLIAPGGADAGAAGVFQQPAMHGWGLLFTALQRQDANHFLRIAVFGYHANDGSAAFFPLYPIAIRAVSFLLGGHPLPASILVSNGAYLAALVLLYDLTVRERSEPVARTTVLLVSLFPTAFFFFAPYAEPLFLLCTVAAFRAAREDRWGRAAVAGALAAATRAIGIVLVPALLVEAWQQSRGGSGRGLRRAAAACAVGIGPGVYAASWWIRSRDALAPLHAQEGWQRSFEPRIWVTLHRAFHLGTCCPGGTGFGYWAIDLALVGIVVAAAAWGAPRLRPAYSVYVWLSLLIPLLYPFPDRPLLSMPRFLIVLFPAFWVIADLVERRRVPRTAVLAAFPGGMAVLTLLFMNWYYIF